MLFPLLLLAAAVSPDPETAARLAAARIAHQANLDAFPTVVVEFNMRPRKGSTLETAAAVAPPTPDTTGRMKIVSHAGRKRVTVVADPAGERARGKGPVGKLSNGWTVGAFFDLPSASESLSNIADPAGRRLHLSPEDQIATIEQRKAGLTIEEDVLKEVSHLEAAPGVTEPGFPGFVAAALAGRLTATCTPADGKLTATFGDPEGGTYEFVLDPARGYLPLAIRASQVGASGGPRRTMLMVIEPRACSGGRWYPSRLVRIVSGWPPKPNLAEGFEYQVISLEVDAPPPAAAFNLTLPAGTKVYSSMLVVGSPMKRLLVDADRTVGPDDLEALDNEANNPPPPDRRLVGGTAPTPADRSARRWNLGYLGAGLVALGIAGLVWRRMGR